MKKSFYASTVLAVALTSLLLACGGGGGDSGNTGTGGTGGTPAPNAPIPAAKFDVSFDKGSLPSSNAEQANLTVTTLDANGNIVAGAPVTVSVDSGIFVGVSSPAVTGTDGTFKGYIKVGGNRSNRVINVSITAAGTTVVNQIRVTGSKIAISGLPATIAAGSTVSNASVLFTDSAGNPLGQQTVSLSQALAAGLTLSKAFPATTDTDGIIRFNLTAAAGAVAGEQTLAFEAGEFTKATQLFTVTSAAQNSVPDVPVSTIVSSTSVLANPTFITTNSVGDMTNKSEISAKFLDASNIGIKDLRVKFKIQSNELAGEQLSPNQSAAFPREYETFTNAAGQATVNYVPGTRSSPTDGVAIEACYRKNDLAITPWICLPNTAKITVGGQPLDVAIFNGSKIEPEGNGNQIYKETLVIQIADAAGNVVPNAPFSASVDITHYGKAANWGLAYPNSPVAPTFAASYATPGLFGLSTTAAPAAGQSIWCVNEDTSRNGSLDAGEDLNNNGLLDPKKSDVALSLPTPSVTDSNGRASIVVSYGQNVGGWLAYTVKVTTKVAGSEGTSQRSFVTNVLKADAGALGNEGSFQTPPYGKGACNSAN